jgi:hypothetical protein
MKKKMILIDVPDECPFCCEVYDYPDECRHPSRFGEECSMEKCLLSDAPREMETDEAIANLISESELTDGEIDYLMALLVAKKHLHYRVTKK